MLKSNIKYLQLHSISNIIETENIYFGKIYRTFYKYTKAALFLCCSLIKVV